MTNLWSHTAPSGARRHECTRPAGHGPAVAGPAGYGTAGCGRPVAARAGRLNLIFGGGTGRSALHKVCDGCPTLSSPARAYSSTTWLIRQPRSAESRAGSAGYAGADGGGIASYRGALKITSSTLGGDSCGGDYRTTGDGMLHTDSGSPTLINGTVTLIATFLAGNADPSRAPTAQARSPPRTTTCWETTAKAKYSLCIE